MALFKRLLKLHQDRVPLEDFLTEVIAHLFESQPELLDRWLQHIGVIQSDDSFVNTISTQQAYNPLLHHTSGSRLDIQIDLVNDQQELLIFIESKVGSQEGFEQLRRYAEILNNLPNKNQKFLLYITRDFDPKEPSRILDKLEQSVQFKQLRWYEFHHFLKQQSKNLLINEICTFLEEYRMASNNQFDSIDVITLTNLVEALHLVEETLSGVVRAKFKEVVGGCKKDSHSRDDMMKYDRYLISYWFRRDVWWCGIGYNFRTDSVTEYPVLELLLEVPPTSRFRRDIIDAMRKISQEYGWKYSDFDDAKSWARIYRQRSLKAVLSEDDHVHSIQEFFLESLKELEEIKQKYHHLPWNLDGQQSTDSDATDSPEDSVH